MQSRSSKFSRWLTGTSLLASAALMFSLLHLRVPFPLLPFLSFDLAEMPSVLALLVIDFRSAFTVAVIHWLALNLGRPYHVLIGPLMKLIAVVSMLIGFRLALSRCRNESITRDKIAAMIGLGSLTRVGVMSLVTFILYYALFPEMYLPVSRGILKNVLGLEVESDIMVALSMVVLTAFFNLIHVFFSLLSATPIYVVYKKITRT